MRIPSLLVIFFLAILPFGSGCRPPIRIVCDVAGTREPVYARDGAFRVATFRGSGMWEVLAVARVVLAGEEETRQVERQYRPSDDSLEIHLEDFLATEPPNVEGRYSFSFSIPEIMAEQTLPQGVVVLDRTEPRISLLTAEGSGATRKEPLEDGAMVFVKERPVRILVEDETACEVTINGERAIPDADGSFSLDPLDTAPLIEAVDRSGNRRSIRPQVRVDVKEPAITWPEGLQKVVYRPDLALEVKVEDDGVLERVLFRLGGKELTPRVLPGGRYTAGLTLEPGENVVEVEALDGAHRRTSSERRIHLETTKVTWTIAGTRGVAYTRDGQHRVARFEGPGDWQVSAVSAFVPAARSTPQEIQRAYKPSGGQLDIFLDDFCLDEKVPSEGRYRFTFTVSGPKMAAEETPTSVVILDRSPPMLFVEVTGQGGEMIERPAGEVTEIAASGESVQVRVGDDSPPCEVRAAGKILSPGRDGVLEIPLGQEPVEITAVDAAGNRAAWKLRRPPRPDTQVPLATAAPRGKPAQDATSGAPARGASIRKSVSGTPALAVTTIKPGASKSSIPPGSTAVLPSGSTAPGT
ncbi:MAG TPA: hypothetical protein VMT52_11905, partial [Planctomycetota bacterium]|nr:hypothetical protein [Planctomycetota bacterium]